MVVAIAEDGVADVLDSLEIQFANPMSCPISSMTTEAWFNINDFSDNAVMSYSDGSKMADAMKNAPTRYPPKLSNVLVVNRCGEHRYIATDQGIWRRRFGRRGQ